MFKCTFVPIKYYPVRIWVLLSTLQALAVSSCLIADAFLQLLHWMKASPVQLWFGFGSGVFTR